MEDILIIAELVNGKLAPVSLQLLGKAHELAKESNGNVVALIMGHDVMEIAKELIKYGADEVIVADHPELAYFRTLPYTRIMTETIKDREPSTVLLAATSQGRDLAPRVAARLQTGLTADCLDLSINEEGLLLQTKPSYGDNVMVDIIIPQHKPQMATVRPNVFPLPEEVSNPMGEITTINVNFEDDDLKTIIREIVPEKRQASRLEESDVVICGGRGMGSKENFDQLYVLAEALGGAVGGTRPAVDENWIEDSYQIGQSGIMVAPKLLITCGVSGAVQFTVGMEKSNIVVAINKDASAPIFNFATYGIVGDVREVIPAILQEIAAI